MTKYYQPEPGSVAKKVMAFFARNPTLRFTTGETSDNLRIAYGRVSNTICKLRELGILNTQGREGHQFNPNHDVVIGPDPLKLLPASSRKAKPRLVEVLPAPANLGNRCYVDLSKMAPGPFGSMKPGQYAFAPASCAAMAA
ncbi:hypothetical protein [Roseateles sp. PN1]|uniref:hypothetical protein n=1 Tax=Roseateles sp. PN1 TaxID=3137372 RepID=UPI003138C660